MPRSPVARTRLPKEIQTQLPRRGIYAVGGGFLSSAWRLVLDADAGTLCLGTSSRQGAPSYGAMEKERTHRLTPEKQAELMKRAREACEAPPPGFPPDFIADYQELLVLLEGDDALVVDGYGPIRQEEGRRAIDALRAAAGF